MGYKLIVKNILNVKKDNKPCQHCKHSIFHRRLLYLRFWVVPITLVLSPVMMFSLGNKDEQNDF